MSVQIYERKISCTTLASIELVPMSLKLMQVFFNPLSANPTKWPNTLKQFVGKLPTNCLSVFGHFVNLALKGLTIVNDLLDLIRGWL